MGDGEGSQARAKMRDETICDAAEEEDAMQPRRRRRRPKKKIPANILAPGECHPVRTQKNNERTYRGTYSREEVRIATKDNGFL